MMGHFIRYEAVKAEDGYWRVVRLRYGVPESAFEATGISVQLVKDSKMPRSEAEGVANKLNGS